MKRRDFLRFGAAAAGAPAVLPFLDLTEGVRTRGRALPGDVIRISSNENPLGVPESAREAMIEGFAEGNRYPGASARSLLEEVARRHGVDASSVILGNGSTDILRMVVEAQAVGRPRLRIVVADPTFEHVGAYQRPHRVELVKVPLTKGSYAHDLGAMKRAADTAPAGVLVYVCNPNNPTGTLTSTREVKRWIETAPEDHLFLVDEAYYDFTDDPGYESLDRLAAERPNLVVARTFSKIYGMAGIRVGYGIAHPETIRRMEEFEVSASPNHLGNVGALAALRDEAFVRESMDTNRKSREIVYDTLDDLGLSYMESHTNFVMHEIRGDVEPYRARMREAGIAVGRPFPPFRDRNRVSLGLPSEMERWADTLRSFREKGWI